MISDIRPDKQFGFPRCIFPKKNPRGKLPVRLSPPNPENHRSYQIHIDAIVRLVNLIEFYSSNHLIYEKDFIATHCS